MKRLLLLLVATTSFCWAEQRVEEPPMASLIPLAEQFPLGLSETNRIRLIDNPKEIEQAQEQFRKELDNRSFPWFFLSMLIGCGGAVWFLYLIRDRLPKPKEKPQPVQSPQEQIEQALQAVELLAYKEEEASHYYGELSSTLLHAIYLHTGRQMASMTTMELKRALQKEKSLSATSLKNVLVLLEQIDQVKFTGWVPSSMEAKLTAQDVFKAIRTIQSEMPSSSIAGAAKRERTAKTNKELRF